MLQKLAGLGYDGRESSPRFISRGSASRLKQQTIKQFSPRAVKALRRSYDDGQYEKKYKSPRYHDGDFKSFSKREIYDTKSNSKSEDSYEKFMKYENHQMSIELLTRRMDILEKRMKTQEFSFQNSESERTSYNEQLHSTLQVLEENVHDNKEMMLKIIKNLRENLMDEVNSKIQKILLPVMDELSFLKKKFKDLSDSEHLIERQIKEELEQVQHRFESVNYYIDHEIQTTKKVFDHSINENLKLITDLTSNLKYLINSKLKFISLETTNAIKEVNVVCGERMNIQKIQHQKNLSHLRQEFFSKMNEEVDLMEHKVTEAQNYQNRRIVDIQRGQKKDFSTIG